MTMLNRMDANRIEMVVPRSFEGISIFHPIGERSK